MVERSGAEAAWRAAEQAVADGRWWDAHEHWEAVWRALPLHSAHARRVRALIQWVAALHKLEQPPPHPGARLDAGMERLIARGTRNWRPGPHPALNALAARLEGAASAAQARWVAKGERPAPHPGMAARIPEAELQALFAGEPA